jgi:hypothetical protein
MSAATDENPMNLRIVCVSLEILSGKLLNQSPEF